MDRDLQYIEDLINSSSTSTILKASLTVTATDGDSYLVLTNCSAGVSAGGFDFYVKVYLDGVDWEYQPISIIANTDRYSCPTLFQGDLIGTTSFQVDLYIEA